MLKNIVIAVQAALIAFGCLWAYLYQHRVDQIFLTYKMNMTANDSRLLVKIAQRIESGQSEEAAKMLRRVATTNAGEIKNDISKLDFRMDDLVSDARDAGKMLEEVGINDVSQALKEREKEAGP